jgi:hypothetical protein
MPALQRGAGEAAVLEDAGVELEAVEGVRSGVEQGERPFAEGRLGAEGGERHA